MVHDIWEKTEEIEKEIASADDSEFKQAITESRKRDYLRPFYHKEEFKRKNKVIPVLKKMRFVYQAGVDLIKGMSREYSKQKATSEKFYAEKK